MRMLTLAKKEEANKPKKEDSTVLTSKLGHPAKVGIDFIGRQSY